MLTVAILYKRRTIILSFNRMFFIKQNKKVVGTIETNKYKNCATAIEQH